MEMKLLRLKPLHLFLIIFFIPIFQLITGFGMEVKGFVIGLFPSMFVYFSWLIILTIKFEELTSEFLKKCYSIRLTKTLLVIVLAFIIPFNWVYTNLLYSGKAGPILMLIGGISFFVFVIGLIMAWITLSKCILVFNGKMDYRANFPRYKSVFFYFLFGPITIWILQRLILDTLNSRKLSR